jgi:hypothetical protein
MRARNPRLLRPSEVLLLFVLLVGLRASTPGPPVRPQVPPGPEPRLEIVYLHVPALTREAVNFRIRTLQAEGEGDWVESLYAEVAGSGELAGAILEQALSAGVPVNLVFAVIDQESHFEPRARGLAGEIGLMQLLPSTFAAVIDAHGEDHLWSVENNLRWGVHYLDTLRGRTDDWDRAVSRYNGRGEAALSYLLAVQRTEKRLDSMFNAALDLHLRGGSRGPEKQLVAWRDSREL